MSTTRNSARRLHSMSEGKRTRHIGRGLRSSLIVMYELPVVQSRDRNHEHRVQLQALVKGSPFSAAPMLLADACRAGLCGVPATMGEVYEVSSIKKMGLSDSICSNGLAHPTGSTKDCRAPQIKKTRSAYSNSPAPPSTMSRIINT